MAGEFPQLRTRHLAWTKSKQEGRRQRDGKAAQASTPARSIRGSRGLGSCSLSVLRARISAWAQCCALGLPEPEGEDAQPGLAVSFGMAIPHGLEKKKHLR